MCLLSRGVGFWGKLHRIRKKAIFDVLRERAPCHNLCHRTRWVTLPRAIPCPTGCPDSLPPRAAAPAQMAPGHMAPSGSGLTGIVTMAQRAQVPSGSGLARIPGFPGKLGPGFWPRGWAGAGDRTVSVTEPPRTIFYIFKTRDTLTQRVHDHPLTQLPIPVIHSFPLWNKATLIS